MSDYDVSILLEMKAKGLEQAALVNAALAGLKEQLGQVDESMKRAREQGDLHSQMLSRISLNTQRTAEEAKRFADTLETRLTPALNNVNKAASNATGGSGSGIMGFLNAIIPGGQTAAALTVIIAGLAVVFAPFTAELAASLVMLGAWVVGATTFAATIALAAGPMLLLAGGIAILGIAAAGGLDPMAKLTAAHKALATATNQTEAAQEAVRLAQLRYDARPTAVNLQILKDAQEQLKETQLKQVAAQNAVNVATQQAAGPVSVLHEKIVALGQAFGKQALPFVNQSATAMINLLPRVQSLGQEIFNWFGPRFPTVLQIALQAINNAIDGFSRLAEAWGHFYDRTVARAPEFGGIINGAFNRVIDGAIGLLLNLERLSNWFVERLPVLGKNANDTLANLGYVVQAIGKGLGVFVDWVIAHWPQINAVFNASWDALKTGILYALPLLVGLRKNWEDLQPALKIFSEHASSLKVLFEALGATFVTVIAILLVFVGLLLLVGAGLVGLFVLFEAGVKKLIDFWHELSKVADVARLVGETAWPTLKKAGQELADSFKPLVEAILSLRDPHEKAATASAHLVTAHKNVQTATEDTRNALVRFLTSDGVIGFATFFAVTMPAYILATVTTLKVMIDAVTVAMTLIAFQVKIAADVMRGDWAQAGKDLQAGTAATTAMMQKTWADTNAAVVSNQAITNGELTKAQQDFGNTMLHIFDTTKSGIITTSRQQKEEQLQIMRETHAAAVGQSIIPDMVNSIIAWFTLMHTASVEQTSLMKAVVNALQSAMAATADLLNHGMYNSASFWFGAIHASVTGWADLTSRSVTGIWNGMVGAAGSAMSQLGGKIHEGIKSAAGVLEGFINAVDDALYPVIKVTAIPRIDVNKLAEGGVIPGYAPGQDTVPALLSPGEAVLTPQAVRQMGGAPVINAINRSSGVAHFAAGGFIPPLDGQCVPYVENALGVFWPVALAKQLVSYVNSQTAKSGEAAVFTGGAAGHVALVTGPGDGFSFPVTDSNWVAPLTIGSHIMNKSMYGFAGFIDTGHGAVAGLPGVATAVVDLLGPIIDGLLNTAKGQISGVPDWIRGLPGPLLDELAGGVKNQFANLYNAAMNPFAGIAGIAGGAVNLAGGLGSWIAQAIAATGVPSWWAPLLAVLVGRESGGNPNAINRTDSNALAGHPSQGLAQVIPGTFAAYHQPGTSGNILDPVANLAAAINYIKARYGSILSVQQANAALPPKGYDSGGNLPTGLSYVWNGTGRQEPVLGPNAQDDIAGMRGLLREVLNELRVLNGRQRSGALTATAQMG